MDRFSTARLHAERLAPAHLDDLVALHRDAAVMRFVGGVRTLETTAAYLETNLRHWDERGFGLWIIRDEAGRFIGRAGVRPLDVEGVEEIEVAYTFIPDCWGKGYTSTRRPVEMVWAEEFQTIHDAIDAERRVKGWTRAKKEALIAGDWATIVRLGSRAKPSASFETRPASPAAPQDDERGDDGGGKLKRGRKTR